MIILEIEKEEGRKNQLSAEMCRLVLPIAELAHKNAMEAGASSS